MIPEPGVGPIIGNGIAILHMNIVRIAETIGDIIDRMSLYLPVVTVLLAPLYST